MTACGRVSVGGAIIVAMSLTACHNQQQSATVEPRYISIIDVDFGRRPRQPDVVILKVELTAEQEGALAEVCRLAKAHFPEGTWFNWGPDSCYREIKISSRDGRFVLQSWHPLFESNPNLIAASYGVTWLGNQTREEFLATDNAAYVAQRNAFDEIERELRSRFGG